MNDEKQQKAVIYCRVSSVAQVTRGHGLDSQESRCRDFAQFKGYEVDSVFRDEGVSGNLIDRPGIKAMLKHLRKGRRSARYVVLIDDISRLARDIRAHWDLRDAITKTGAALESPAIEFGTDSNGRMFESVVAVTAQHAREVNKERVISRMQARVRDGYYIFAPIIGYRFDKVPGHGKMLVPDEPNASLVREALEGFASGRFQSATEVKRYLERFPTIRRNKHGEVRLQTVIDMLERPLYAGYITVGKWDIYLQPGKHEPLISFATWQRIQKRLNGNAHAPARKDLSADFPLRGFVACPECGNAMTAAWSKGRSNHYGYYFCQTRGCGNRRKSIRKEQIEADFERLLRQLRPSRSLFETAYTMMRNLWQARVENMKACAKAAQVEIVRLERKTEKLVERILNTETDALVTAYEKQVRKLEEEKIALLERADTQAKPKLDFERTYRTAMSFLANPWKLWDSGLLEHKRMVLRLAFSGLVPYCPETGYRTAETTLPFKLLGGPHADKCKLVEAAGIEPASASPLPSVLHV